MITKCGGPKRDLARLSGKPFCRSYSHGFLFCHLGFVAAKTTPAVSNNAISVFLILSSTTKIFIHVKSMRSVAYNITVRKSRIILKFHFALSGRSPTIVYVVACE